MLNTLAKRTLGEVLRYHARQTPDAPALISDGRRLSWAELDDEVDRLSAHLLSLGIGPGEAVGFLLTKRPEVVTGFLACARIGAVMAPINFKLTADRLRDQLETGKISAIFTESQHDEILRALLPLIPDPRRILYVDTPARYGESTYADAMARPPGPPTLPREVLPGDTCYFNYTSGTTGRPKGAIATHRNILFNALTAFDRPEAEGLGFDGAHVFLGMFSVFAHPHELFHRSLLCGGPFVILDTLSPRVVCEAIARHRVSWMMAVPSFYEMMQDHLSTGGRHDLSSLRVLESGGAYVGEDALERMERCFGAAFMPVWGSTETTGVAVALRPDRPRRPGTTGRPVPGYEVRAVDHLGRDVAPGEVGELIVRGEAVVPGYINQPEETAALFVDGWYHTQDLVTWTEDGFLRFVGRRSEMLKIGGIRVYPLEIEQVVAAHPDVREVVVVRAEERIRGEVPRAILRTAPDSTLNVRKLRRYLRDRLAVYQIPRIVEFWREIPHLPNGKIDKAAVLAVPPDPDRDER